MYDKAMAEDQIDIAIHAFARRNAQATLSAFGPDELAILKDDRDPDPETTVMRRALNRAATARQSLAHPPVERLRIGLETWISDMEAVLADPPPPFPDETPDERRMSQEVDAMVLARIREIKAVLDTGDVDAAFDALRKASQNRDTDPYPIEHFLPDVFDVNSAHWLDLVEVN